MGGHCLLIFIMCCTLNKYLFSVAHYCNMSKEACIMLIYVYLSHRWDHNRYYF